MLICYQIKEIDILTDFESDRNGGIEMSGRLIIVSNRLPYNIAFKDDSHMSDDDSTFEFMQSSGGLVSGLKPLSEEKDTIWLGWADTHDITLADAQCKRLVDEFSIRGCVPVFLDEEDAKSYYDGFSNSAIWPLFHYFAQFCSFEENEWESYKRVNLAFCDALKKTAKPGDTIWIHDYHLMLLPRMVREQIPDVSIGFFLHIPFPSYEMFRILPCRDEILTGLLGADLIGFHTYDYTRHFLSSCRRILTIENQYGTIAYDDRIIQTDAFPLGIDYDLFSDMAKQDEVKKLAEDYLSDVNGCKVILSIERLDYSKGILNSLNAYSAFLENHPEWQGKIILTMVIVPSRENVESYQELKCQVDELVGQIQGKFSTQSWSPIDYFYRSLPLKNLCGLYVASEIMLVAPLRDGMNLVSKEYLATHDDGPGALILAEMAGSAYELSDAIVINPFNTLEYENAFLKALTMSEDEQIKANTIMQKRLKQYTSRQWAKSFIDTLTNGISKQTMIKAQNLDDESKEKIKSAYDKSKRRGIILDYDGTLVGFKTNPDDAYPDKELLQLLTLISANKRNDVVIISGRDHETLDKWFNQVPLDMISEHGIWHYRQDNDQWIMNEPIDDGWKKTIRSELESFVIRTPGSFIEEKNCSLVWHCRGATEELGQRRMLEISAALSLEVESKGLMLLQGNKVIEIKPQSINKGRAAYAWLQEKKCDFVFAAGDDNTDEDIFHVLPQKAWTVKVGMKATEARYFVEGYNEIRQLLQSFL